MNLRKDTALYWRGVGKGVRHNGGTGESPRGCASVAVQFLICSIYSLCILHAFQFNNSQQNLSHDREMDEGMLMDELPIITGVLSAVILKSEGGPHRTRSESSNGTLLQRVNSDHVENLGLNRISHLSAPQWLGDCSLSWGLCLA